MPSILRNTGVQHLALLAALLILAVLLVSPRREFPLNDDWDAAHSTLRLLETGRPHVSGWANAAAVFPLYWGALFARLAGGFSFTALRCATLVMSFIGVAGFYGLLRRGGTPPNASLLGAATLLVNPLYLYLSYTFMTDVYFLAMALLALLAYLAGIQNLSRRALCAGSLAATLALATRQPGLFLPVAALPGLLAARGRLRIGDVLAVAGAPLAAWLLLGYWLREVNGVPWNLEYRLAYGTLRTQPNAVETFISRALVALPYLGLMAGPALAARAAAFRPRGKGGPSRRAWIEASAVAVIGAASVFAVSKYGEGVPFTFGNVLNAAGVGTVSLPGSKLPLLPDWAADGLAWISLPAGAVLAWLGLRAAGRQLDAALVLLGVGGAAITGSGWLLSAYYDRYLLPALPVALWLVLRGQRLSRAALACGWLAAALTAAYSLAGVADYLDWNEARWTAGRTLLAQGAPAEDIDGGYEWIGWHEFESAPPPAAITPDLDPLYWMRLHPRRYLLAFTELEGYSVVAAVPYNERGGQVVALRRR